MARPARTAGIPFDFPTKWHRGCQVSSCVILIPVDLNAFKALLKHPAPGLSFAKHESPDAPPFILPVFNGAMPNFLRLAPRLLTRLESSAPGRFTDLVTFYRRYRYACLFLLHDPMLDQDEAALTLLAVRDWKAHTELLRTEGAWQIEDNPVYHAADWYVFAVCPAEDTRFVLFTSGELDGRSLAGKVFYLSLDPVHALDEPFAGSFGEFMDRLTHDPTQFLKDIAYTIGIPTGPQHGYAQLANAYIPDTRGMADRFWQPRPRTRS
jgi:hypothetical protein